MQRAINTKIISVFGSHAPQPGSEEYELAREVGRLIAEANFSVSTGGYGGTMAAVSQGAADAGGHVIGVTSEQVEQSRQAQVNEWVQEEIRYRTLEERVMHLVVHNQGMIVLPGGIGTLSEFAFAWSMMQVEEMDRRPLILLGQMWSDTMSGFVNPAYVAAKHLDLIIHVSTPVEALAILKNE